MIGETSCQRCGQCCTMGDADARVRCKHLMTAEDGTHPCAIYETRPQACRDFEVGGLECHQVRVVTL